VSTPAASAEYRLSVDRTLSTSTRRPCIRIALSTTKSFSTFRYGLTVEEHLEGNRLSLKVLGLDAPDLTLPGSGPAEFVREYEGLTGDCSIEIRGLDGKTTTVRCAVSASAVTLLEPVSGPVIVDLPGPSSPTNTAQS
jgi:hypothetical protein